MVTSTKIRAVRNNNPGNIERGGKWQGLMPESEMTDAQRNEDRFCVFKSPVWGFRAMAVLLITYYDKRKAKDGSRIDTIAEAIERWAPPVENQTGAYIGAVDKAHPRKAHEVFNFHDYADLAPLVKAIATHECGGWFFDDKDLQEGLHQAGVIKPESLVASTTIKAATIGGVATTMSLASDLVQQLTPATSVATQIASFAPSIAAGIVLLVVVVIIYQRYDRWKRTQQ